MMALLLARKRWVVGGVEGSLFTLRLFRTGAPSAPCTYQTPRQWTACQLLYSIGQRLDKSIIHALHSFLMFTPTLPLSIPHSFNPRF